MFVRMLRDVNVSPDIVLRNNKVYDVPSERGNSWVNSGVASIVTSDPGEYRPDAIAVTGGSMSGVAVTGGSINNTPIGATTRSTGAFTTLAVTRTDSSGTPGNVTNNSALGRAAFAAAGTSVVVTNSSVAAASEVFVNLITTDATLTSCRVTAIAAGSFTVTGNAAATAAATFSFLVIN